MSSTPALDHSVASRSIDELWEQSILPSLSEYIKIPNKSPQFDPRWRENGHMDRAVALVEAWCREHAPEDATLEVVRLEQRTPLILIEVPGQVDDTVMLYGHLDKQPEMVGWREGLGPWAPVRDGDRLYGRGGADDGYAAYASLAAIRALREQGVPHARCVVLIEACEESGSFDLPAYMEHLAGRIGQPSLVVCLDSGCGDYQRLWATTNLRGFVMGDLTVKILREGVHSGDASGIVPDSFRIARRLLDRVEDPDTGRVLPEALWVEVPEERQGQAAEAAAVLGKDYGTRFPFVAGAGPVAASPADWVLNRTWRPALTITGAGGLPALEDAGNVLRPQTTLKLSMRTPPTLDTEAAGAALKQVLESDPPYGAEVSFEYEAARGWNAPALAPWLAESMQRASMGFFGQGPALMGEGGSIPFMAMLGERYPEAQFLITGLLGPESNAHGPNEFLHIPCGKRLTGCVAQVLADHARR